MLTNDIRRHAVDELLYAFRQDLAAMVNANIAAGAGLHTGPHWGMTEEIEQEIRRFDVDPSVDAFFYPDIGTVRETETVSRYNDVADNILDALNQHGVFSVHVNGRDAFTRDDGGEWVYLPREED